jgi:hypothetical protein
MRQLVMLYIVSENDETSDQSKMQKKKSRNLKVGNNLRKKRAGERLGGSATLQGDEAASRNMNGRRT